ncbi:MAG TPA: DUF58 domain-containing protein [Candidatus Deferrimicrobiaceae bacterium]|nr:DUF58 domain-containing protein [Candidatus Deferrimicrobiaceae bacterium]
MTWRPTALNLSLLTVVGWALFLSVLTGRTELAVVAVPPVVALVAGRRAAPAPVWRIQRELSTTRVLEDERVTVTVTLRADGPLALVELLEPLPSRARLARGSNHAFFTLRAGREIRWTFELRAAGRQHLRLGGLHLRRWGPLGLAAAETHERAPAVVAVYPRPAPIRYLPRPRRTQTSVGNYVSPAQGEGIEPGDIRPFAPGDQVRHVNWRATLKLGTLHVTQHHRERNADVVLLLDTLTEVGRDGDTVVDVAARGAAALAAGYLARKDRVGLIEYGGQPRWVRPGAGRSHLERVLDALLSASVVFTYVNRDLDLVPPRILPPQALVVALSPLLDRRFVRVATDLAARGFDLLVIAVSPIPAARAAARRSPVADVAARLWALERRVELDEYRRRGLTIVEWDGVGPLDAALAALGPRWRRRVLAG